jgi:2-hydroxychromene-2-carboxylate isomerase
MKKTGDSFQLNATDLIGYLNCRHLAALDRAVAEGALAKPKVWDPLVALLLERGAIHEQNFVDHLAKAGLRAAKIEGIEVTDDAVAETLAAMKAGAPVIVQAALAGGDWVGRADVLRRVFSKSETRISGVSDKR